MTVNADRHPLVTAVRLVEVRADQHPTTARNVDPSQRGLYPLVFNRGGMRMHVPRLPS